jgi:hypothetical protein
LFMYVGKSTPAMGNSQGGAPKQGLAALGAAGAEWGGGRRRKRVSREFGD